MSADDAIAEFKAVLALCDPLRQWEGRVLCLKTSAIIDFQTLRQLEDHHFIVNLDSNELNTAYARNKDYELPSGSNLRFEVPQQASSLVVVQNLRTLLECPGVETGQLGAYAICDNGIFISYSSERPDLESSLPAYLKRFHAALRHWKLLEKWSDHTQDDGTLLYFGLRRVAVDPGFTEEELPDDDNSVAEIEQFMTTQDRADIRREIFKTVLADQLRDVSASRAFPHLLKRTVYFWRRLRESLAIYLSEHSPERLQKVAETSALELSEKLEGIISGLETKSLTVAPALLVAFKEALPGQGGVSLNLVTMSAAVLYGVSMTWAHFSQESLIQHVKTLAEQSKDEVEQQGLSQDNRALTTIFPNLIRRAKNAKIASWVVFALSWLPTAAVIYYAWFGDVPVNQDGAETK